MCCGETPPDTHQPFCMQRRRRHSNTIPRAQLHFLSNFVKKSTGLCQVFDIYFFVFTAILILSFTWTGGTRYVGT